MSIARPRTRSAQPLAEGRLLLAALFLMLSREPAAAADWSPDPGELVDAVKGVSSAIQGRQPARHASATPLPLERPSLVSPCPGQRGMAQEASQIIAPVAEHLCAAAALEQPICIEVDLFSTWDAHTNSINRITVSRELIGSLQNDHQLAGILAHELAHIALHRSSEEFRYWLRTRAREEQADLLAASLLSRAGYDPLGLAGALHQSPGPLGWTKDPSSSHRSVPERTEVLVGELRWKPKPKALASPPPRVLADLKAALYMYPLGWTPPAEGSPERTPAK